MQGVSTEVTRGLSGMRAAGEQAGRDMGQGVADGLKRAEGVVAKASKNVAKTRELEVSASAKVRIEEAKLQELRDRGVTEGSRFMAAEERLRVARDRSVAATRNARQASEDLTTAQGRLAAAQRENADAANQSSAATADAGNSMDELGNKSVLTGENIAKFGAVAGAALLGVGAALFEIGSTFDDVSDTIRIGTGATGDKLAGLEQIAKNIGSTVPASFEDIGSTVADLNTRLGLTGEPLELLSKQVLETGNLFGEALDIDSLTAGFNAFSVKGSDTSKVLDELFQVSQATGVGMNELTASAVKGAPALKQFGFSMSASAGLIGSLDKAGLDADKTMGALTKALGAFAKDGKDPQQALYGTVVEMEKFIAAGDDAAAIALGGKVFGTKGAAQFVDAVKLGTLSVDDFVAATGATGDTILGAAADTKDFAEQWMIFKNKVLIALEPIATKVFTAISQAMGWIAENGIPAVKSLGVELGKIGTAFSAVTGFVSDNGTAFKVVGSIIAVALLPYLTILAVGYTAVGLAAIASAGQQALAWTVSSAGAVKAAILTVAQSWRIIGAWVMMGARATAQAAVVAAGWVATSARAAVAAAANAAAAAGVVASWVMMGARATAQAAIVAAGWVATGARAGVAAIANAGAAAKVVAAWVLMGARATAQAVVVGAAWLASSAGAALATTRTLAYIAVTNAVRLATITWTGVQWLLNAALTANPIGLIVVGIGALIAAIVLIATKTTWFQTIWDVVWGGIKVAFGLWWAGVQIYFNALKAAFQAVGDAAMWLWNNAILPAFDGIKAVISLWWTGVQMYFNFVKDAFTAIANKAVEMKDGIVNAFNFVVDFVRGIGTTIKDAAGNIWGFLIDGLKEAIHAVGRVLKNVNIKIPGWVPGVGGKEFGFKSVGEAMEKLRDGGVVSGRRSDGSLYGPGTGTSDSLLGVDAFGMPIVRVSKDETVVTADASSDPANASAMAAMNAGWSIGDWLKKLPGHATGGVVGEPYGLPGGSAISYGSPGFPDWVNQLGQEHGVRPSTYAGHQEGDRNEPGYAPNPEGLNRGIDWDGSVAQMQGFADFLMGIAPNTPALEQIIWMNPETGQKAGWAGRSADVSGSYFASDYGGHQDHVHTRQSASFGSTPVDTGPLEQPGLAPGGPDVPQTPTPPATSTTPSTPSTPAEPEKAFSGRDRFKKFFTDAGSIAADSLIEIAGVGEWLDLADRYTIKPSDTAATSSTPQSSATTSTTPSTAQPTTPPTSMELDYPARDPAPTSGPGFYSHEIARSAKDKGLDRLAAVIGHMTALVESGDPLKMFANTAVPESLAFPHDAVGSDHDSIGLFQQRNSGWGTVAQRMNPFDSAGMFYDKLKGFDYHTMDPGAAAQKVQVSAFPEKYAEKQGRADQLVNETGLFDTGGIWEPGTFGFNGLNEPEMVLKQNHWDTAEAAINTVKDLAMAGASGRGDVTNIHATFRDERAFYEERRREARLGMKRHSGRFRR
jgi:phage-related minor tail protein